MTNSRNNVFLIDDHPLVLEGLERLMNAEPDLYVCGTATSTTKALEALTRISPQIIVTDLSMEQKNSYEFITHLCILHKNIPVLVLSMHEEVTCAERTLAAGARGYVTKASSTDEILEAIRALLNGKTFVTQHILKHVLAKRQNTTPSLESILSARELEVFRLIGLGYKVKRIASEMNLSPKTVDSHCGNIKTKLKLSDTHELVQQAAIWVHNG